MSQAAAAARPSDATIKRLFAVSGNQCAFPGCPNALVDATTGTVTGVICHIRAHRPGGPRFDPEQPSSERHAFDNLLLLCPIHHKIVDSQGLVFTVEFLLDIKAKHETAFAGGMEPPDAVVTGLIRNTSEWLEELVELQRRQIQHAEERDKPRFEVVGTGGSGLLSAFTPRWRVRQATGDHVTSLEWRFRGPRFSMAWQQALGSALERTPITYEFDLTSEPALDERVERDELGLEIRVPWHGAWKHELHRYPLAFHMGNVGMLCDVGREILPVDYFDET